MTTEQAQTQTQAQTLTVLRIKRRRDEEPLDALVIEELERAKRLKSGDATAREGAQRGIFRLAETVEPKVFASAASSEQLKTRLANLTRTATPPSAPRTSVKASPNASREDLRARAAEQGRRARYRVVEQRRMAGVALQDDGSLRFLDAVADTPAAAAALSSGSGAGQGRRSSAAPQAAEPTDDQMKDFLPLLNQYLTLQDSITPRSPHPSKPAPEAPSPFPAAPTPPPPSAGAPRATVPRAPVEDDGGDYVFDVYYRDVQPVAEEEVQRVLRNVGALSGFIDDDDLMNDYSSDSDFGDEADEDSNDESYYRNDYPEDESEQDDYSDY